MKNKMYLVLSILVTILIWKVLSIIIDSPILIPSPEKSVLELLRIIQSKYFFIVIRNTAVRVILGFTFSFTLALVLGIIASFIPAVYFLLKPLVIIQKSVPTLAVILLAIIWLSSELAPILVAFLISFPIIYSTVTSSINNIDIKLLEMAKVYKLSKKLKLKKIYIPAIKSDLFAVISTAIGLSLKVTIAAEVLSQPAKSIGTSFQIEKATLNTAGVFAWSIIVIVLAALLDVIINTIQKKYSKEIKKEEVNYESY